MKAARTHIKPLVMRKGRWGYEPGSVSTRGCESF
jgi:hypothetical protein